MEIAPCSSYRHLHRRAFRDVGQSHFVALRHESFQYQTTRKLRFLRQAKIIDDNGHIVVLIQTNVARFLIAERW
jgi:hypothetical protein